MKFHHSDEEIIRACGYISSDTYLASLYGVPIERVRQLRGRRVKPSSVNLKRDAANRPMLADGAERRLRDDATQGSKALLAAIIRYYGKYHCNSLLQTPKGAATGVHQQPKETPMCEYLDGEKALNKALRDRREQAIYIRWNGCTEAPLYKVYFQEDLTELVLIDNGFDLELQRSPIGSRTYYSIDNAANYRQAADLIVEEIRTAIAEGELTEGE